MSTKSAVCLGAAATADIIRPDGHGNCESGFGPHCSVAHLLHGNHHVAHLHLHVHDLLNQLMHLRNAAKAKASC